MHILDQIKQKSDKLRDFLKKYEKTKDENLLPIIDNTRIDLENFLKKYGKQLAEEKEIFGDLPNLLSDEDMKRFGLTDGSKYKLKKCRKRRSKSKRKSKRRSKKRK